MSQFRIDESKAFNKWSKVLENVGITGDKAQWMSTYSEYHSLNENAYVNAWTGGMGAVTAPQPSLIPGLTSGSTTGSGDVAQNMLPVAMKVAAQTIGLDLVATKPSAGPRLELLFIDFVYDNMKENPDEKPQVFQIKITDPAIKANVIADLKAELATAGIIAKVGGLQGGRLFFDIANGAYDNDEPVSKTGWVEFLGFSRINNNPMFREFRQANTASSGAWTFDATKNTFASAISIETGLLGADFGAGVLTANNYEIDVISMLEDHIPGFSANWYSAGNDHQTGAYPMTREHEELTYAGVVGTKLSSKSVQVGTIEISAALRRTEMEDIKSATGIDIVQKMESILVNELSQTISKQIVDKVFELGTLNRSNSVNPALFTFDTSYVTSLSGENSHAVQRRLITVINNASNYIAVEGRVGGAQYIVTNGFLASQISDIAGYTINPFKNKMSTNGQVYPAGQIGDMAIYVDPNMRWDDYRIALGRKNSADQPGLIFVPYLMAQSISLIAETTFAPRILLRSRYAVTEVGFFPERQFMVVDVVDAAGVLTGL